MNVERFLSLWGLNSAEGARALGVSEEVLRGWLGSEDFEKHTAFVELSAATAELERRVKRESIRAVVRRESANTDSLLELAYQGRHAEVSSVVCEMFDLRRVQP